MQCNRASIVNLEGYWFLNKPCQLYQLEKTSGSLSDKLGQKAQNLPQKVRGPMGTAAPTGPDPITLIRTGSPRNRSNPKGEPVPSKVSNRSGPQDQPVLQKTVNYEKIPD